MVSRAEIVMSEGAKKFDPEAASDVDLLNAVAQGSEPAFEELRRRYNGRVRTLIRSELQNGCTNPSDHSEDQQAETWIRIWKYAKPFDETRGTVEAYIATVARHRACSHRLRCRLQQQREAIKDDKELALIESLLRARDWATTISHEQAIASYELIHNALSELDEDHQTVVTLRIGDGLPYAEIAKRTHQTIANIKVIIFRFKKKCRELAEGASPEQ